MPIDVHLTNTGVPGWATLLVQSLAAAFSATASAIALYVANRARKARNEDKERAQQARASQVIVDMMRGSKSSGEQINVRALIINGSAEAITDLAVYVYLFETDPALYQWSFVNPVPAYLTAGQEAQLDGWVHTTTPGGAKPERDAYNNDRWSVPLWAVERLYAIATWTDGDGVRWQRTGLDRPVRVPAPAKAASPIASRPG